MLVLTRKKGESIIILVDGKLIEVTINDIQGEQVKVGINAKRDVAIYRKEIYEIMQKENKEASKLESFSIEELIKEKK